jgi:hypothetical protein
MLAIEIRQGRSWALRIEHGAWFHVLLSKNHKQEIVRLVIVFVPCVDSDSVR